MNALSRLISLFGLVLSLAAGSVTMVMARDLIVAPGQIVICTGNGLVALQVDANGKPIGQTLPCPDMIPAILALDHGDAAPLIVAPWHLTPVGFAQRAVPAQARAPTIHRLSRAPPALT